MRPSVLALLVPALLAAPSAAGAQTTPAQVRFGLLGSFNMSTLGGSDVARPRMKGGFSVGALVRLPISNAWSFQPELEYAGKGVRMKSTTTPSGPYTETVGLGYLEAPLLLRLSARSTPSGRLFVEAGPAPAVNLRCSISLVANAVSVSTSCASRSLDPNSFDVGAIVGVGLELPLGTRSIWAGVRYNYGLTDVADGSNARNRNLQIVGGLIL